MVLLGGGLVGKNKPSQRKNKCQNAFPCNKFTFDFSLSSLDYYSSFGN